MHEPSGQTRRNLVRFVRTLQHRATAQGSDFYALSIPPQVAEALDLKDGGKVELIVSPGRKGRYEVTLNRHQADQISPWK